MNKPTIYLAGKMSGLDFNTMNNWRKRAKYLLELNSDKPLHIINPVDFYNFEMDRNTYTEKEIKEFDLWAVKRSDLILVELINPDSIGTAIEIYEAHDNQGTPVIGFGNGDIHPWMKLCLTKHHKTLEEAVEHIVDFYLPNL